MNEMSPMTSWHAFPLDIFFKELVFPIIDSIGELTYPIAENHESSLVSAICVRAWQINIKFNMAVPEDEIVDIRVLFNIVFGEEYQMFLVFAEISHVVSFFMLDIAMACPC